MKALDDDLNTPEALAVFFEWMRKVNTQIDENSLKEEDVLASINFLSKFNSLFDLIFEKFDVPKGIIILVEEREKARNNKDWLRADTIRDQILKMGWIIEDSPSGYKLKPTVEQ